MVPAAAHTPYYEVTMDFRSAIREVLREELALLLPMTPSILVGTAPFTTENLTLTDTVRQ